MAPSVSTPQEVISSAARTAEALQRLDPAVSWPSLHTATDLPQVLAGLTSSVHALQVTCTRLRHHLAHAAAERNARASDGDKRGEAPLTPAMSGCWARRC